MRILLVLIVIAVTSALAVVNMKYRTRLLFADYQRLQQGIDFYEEEWAHLQLEQTTWAERSRVERLAREQLGMEIPSKGSVISVKP